MGRRRGVERGLRGLDGMITRFIVPDRPSIVRARLATSTPIALNASEPSRQIPPMVIHAPRTGTPNASRPKTIGTTTSTGSRMRRQMR